MFPRSAAEAIEARETVDLIFGAGAPHALARLFNGGDRQPDHTEQGACRPITGHSHTRARNRAERGFTAAKGLFDLLRAPLTEHPPS